MKPIVVTDELIRKYVAEFESELRSMKLNGGRISFTKELSYAEDKNDPQPHAIIRFEPKAFAKMMLLLDGFSSEVAWHGFVRRDGKKEFVIYDIAVYPQTVTGVTVETDEAEYTKWSMTLSDEEFNSMKCQCHSHVNMACTPSATDLKCQSDIISQLNGDQFYIFMIWNKRLECTAWIYDLGENVLYEDKDIVVLLVDESIGDFLSASKQVVVTKTFASKTATAHSAKKKSKPQSQIADAIVGEDSTIWDDLGSSGYPMYSGKGYW